MSGSIDYSCTYCLQLLHIFTIFPSLASQTLSIPWYQSRSISSTQNGTLSASGMQSGKGMACETTTSLITHTCTTLNSPKHFPFLQRSLQLLPSVMAENFLPPYHPPHLTQENPEPPQVESEQSLQETFCARRILYLSLPLLPLRSFASVS